MKRLLALLAAGALTLGLNVGAGAAPRFEHLDPGGPADFDERVPVNFVFVGYNRTQVDEQQFLRGLPSRYRTVVRSRLWYGVTEPLGVDYTYDYNTRFTGREYKDRFFGYLSSAAKRAPLTDYQKAYNDQKSNVLNVRNNHHIDAPSVERWLAKNPPDGIDTSENTIFFVNWFGRRDFKHHVYTKTDEPDPDTNYNFGVERQSRKIIAWGGTTADDEENGLGSTHRVWFYDLSAGPESWTDNWNVDDLDLDDNGTVDYRMPPIWEYLRNGFRDKARLSGDLSKVARYVGLDLLFTTSPLYPPDITPPDLPRSVNLDSNTYEGWFGTDASSKYITRPLLLEELRELQPDVDYSFDNEDVAFRNHARRCYVLWLKDVSCAPNRPYPAFANLFVYNAVRLERFLDRPASGDYQAGLFNYSTGRKYSAPFLGFADDNYVDGTQSLVFSFVSPQIVDAGYGLTTTQIHEVGHHVGMSHPHDGFDWESRTHFAPADRFYFAWSGDENNSMMSYIDLNWDFSQFDRDNMNRFMAAAYVRNANDIAADIIADPDAGAASEELEAADGHIGRAEKALAAHGYRTAAAAAQRAYAAVRAGARQAGVKVVGSKAGTHVEGPRKRNRMKSSFVDRLGAESHRARP